MSEVLFTYDHIIAAPDGTEYRARACGRPSGNHWEGWIEFLPLGEGQAQRTPRETTQPSRSDLEYWATGLSAIYLEGAIKRVPKFAVEVRVVGESEAPIFDGPAPPVRPVETIVVLPPLVEDGKDPTR